MADILAQLQSIKAHLAGSDVVELDTVSRLEAVKIARSISIDLEDPGDLIDRIIYQVHLPHRSFHVIERFAI